MKNSMVISQKIKIESPYDPAIPLLGEHPKVMKAGTWTDIYIPTFIAALYTIAKRGKYPKHPPVGELDKEKVV